MSTRSVKTAIVKAGPVYGVDEVKEIIAESVKGGETTGEQALLQNLFDTGNLSKPGRVELGKHLTPDGRLESLIPADWRKALSAELATPSFAGLETFLAHEASSGAKVFPPRDQIFAALASTPLNKVRVVIIGQDPYPTAGNANGLAFSVTKGMKVPGSLQNIYKGLAADVGTALPSSGDLTPWAQQGVLLLNTVLTVREGEPNSHRGQGWETLTEAMLKKVNETRGPVVFLCFGAQAKAMAEAMVDTGRHTIISAPHPSPLNGRKFEQTCAKEHLFRHTNEVLTHGGRGTIDWQIP